MDRVRFGMRIWLPKKMRPSVHGRAGLDPGHSGEAWKEQLERTLLLLVDVPRMLRDIVVDLAAGAADVGIAGEVTGAHAVDKLRRTEAGFVVGGGLERRLISDLLHARPAAGVLTVSDDGHGATLHRLVERETRLGELSPDRLLAIVRAYPEEPS